MIGCSLAITTAQPILMNSNNGPTGTGENTSTQNAYLPKILGIPRANQTLTVDEGALTAVSERVWEVNGVAQLSETGTTFNTALLSAGDIVTVKSTGVEGTFQSPGVLIYMNHALAHHNMMDDAMLALVPHVDATYVAITNGLWSDADTWDLGTVPMDGAVVLIPVGIEVTYDIAVSPRLDRLRVDGTLRWALDQSTHLHVETITCQNDAAIIIGSSVHDRLQEQYTAEIVISDRSYRIDADNPTDLDIANDPELLSRGLIGNGLFQAFGHFVTPWVRTMAPPMAGDTAIILDEIPKSWNAGDTIVVPATFNHVDSGSTLSLDEERVITNIDGNIVTIDAPLVQNHWHHNSSVTRTDLTPIILNKTRNIVVRSESKLEKWHRGHVMMMHGSAQFDLWSIAFLDLGRTDKSVPAGIKDGDQLRIADHSSNIPISTTTEPFTARSNIQSRYPVHGHFMGFGRNQVPLIRDCHIEDSPSWLGVHHGCEMDWFNNSFYKFGGAGLVSETGNELGAWVGNAAGSYVGAFATTGAQEGGIKNLEAGDGGLVGDFGRHGSAFYMRGRAMRVNSNVAFSTIEGYSFYHRAFNDTLSSQISLDRSAVDLDDLSPLAGQDYFGDFPTTIPVTDYPIVHFAHNESIGCYRGMFVTKATPNQGHDFNINLKNFKAWGCHEGGTVEYIGAYALTDFDIIGLDQSETPASYQSTSTGFMLGTNSQQVAWVRGKCEGFERGLTLRSGSIFSSLDNWDNTNNPMFMVVAADLSGNTNGIHYVTDAVGTNTGNTAEDVTKIYATEPTYQEPTVNIPFMIGVWAGATSGGNIMEQPVDLIKMDSVGQQPFSGDWGIGKEWDNAGLQYSELGTKLFFYVRNVGYYQVEGSDYILFSNYYSDRLTGRPIKKLHGIRKDANINGQIDNGPFVFSTTQPNRDDIVQTVAKNTPVTIDIIAAATVESGATAILDSAFFAPDHGKASVNVTTGQVTYTPDHSFTGSDTMYVWVTDGHGGYDTVKIEFNVGATALDGDHTVLLFGQSNAGNMGSSQALQNELTALGSDARVLSTAVGSTGLVLPDSAWNIITGDGNDTPGSAYTGTLSAIDALIADTPGTVFTGAIWMQGENDTFRTDLSYASPLTALFEAVSTHIGTEFPIYVVGLSQYQALPSAGIIHVNNEMQIVANAMANVHYIDMDAEIITPNGFTQAQAMHDSLHYSQAVFDALAGLILEQPQLSVNLGLNTSQD